MVMILSPAHGKFLYAGFTNRHVPIPCFGVWEIEGWNGKEK